MQRFSCVLPGMERFPLDLTRAVKKGCALEVGCLESVVAGEIFFDFVI